MAYISTEKVRDIRKNLKEAFPKWKFSLTKDRHSAIRLAVVKAPHDIWADYYPVDKYKDPHNVDLDGKMKAVMDGFTGVNHHWIRRNDTWTGKTKEAFCKMIDICMEGNHDNSDIMTDYFDVGWYFTMTVGKWNKPVEIPNEES